MDKKINLHLWYVSRAIIKYFLFIRMFRMFSSVNLTPLVYDAAFLLAHDKDVQHKKILGQQTSSI